MIVMKFGGTSVGNADRIRKTSEIIRSQLDKKPIVVVSAVTKVTDLLIKLAEEASKCAGDETLDNIRNIHYKILHDLEIATDLLDNDLNGLRELTNEAKASAQLDAKILDKFKSFGERMSSKIVSAQLSNMGIKSKAIDSWDLGLLTNNDFGNAEPLEESYLTLKNNISKIKETIVTTGFIGKTIDSHITTLGRGGSDYSAAIIGMAIDADEIQIWTDVNGIMTTDPKIVADARPVRQVSFAEASELAYFGAKVLHPKTILPAMRKNIPVRVLNSFNPSDEGTKIVSSSKKSEYTIKAIACKNKTALIHIDSTRMLGAYGFLARLFYIFDKYKKSVDVISTSEVSVSLTIDENGSIDGMISELKEIGDVEIYRNKSIICIVGEGMKHTSGIAGRTFSALGRDNINIEMISQGASKINITFIVDGKDTQKAVQILHEEYFGRFK